MNQVLAKEYEYFDKNRKNIIKDHENEYVVICNNEVVGYYDNEIKAINETQKKYELGTFIVKKCIPHEEDVQKYHSRAMFG